MNKTIYILISVCVLFSCNRKGSVKLVDANGFSVVKLNGESILFRKEPNGKFDLIFYDHVLKNNFYYSKENGISNISFDNGTGNNQITMADVNGDIFPDFVSIPGKGIFQVNVSLIPCKSAKTPPVTLRELMLKQENNDSSSMSTSENGSK